MFAFSAPEQGAAERLMQAYSSFLEGDEASENGIISDEILGHLAYTLGTIGAFSNGDLQ